MGETIDPIVLDSSVVSYIFNSDPIARYYVERSGVTDSTFHSKRLRRPGTVRIAAVGAQGGCRNSQAILNDMRSFGQTPTWWRYAPVCALNEEPPVVS